MIYIFLTWVIANLLHPLILIVYFGIGGGGMFSEGLFQAFLLLLICSFLFSIPSLIISCLLIYALKVLPLTLFQKYIAGVLIAVAIPFLNLVILEYIENDLFREFDTGAAIPASISVLFAVLIRHKQFIRFLLGVEYDDFENSLSQKKQNI
jgi:hypothetical protein